MSQGSPFAFTKGNGTVLYTASVASVHSASVTGTAAPLGWSSHPSTVGYDPGVTYCCHCAAEAAANAARAAAIARLQTVRARLLF